MSIVTLTVSEFATLLQSFDVVMLPVSVQGFIYAVKRGYPDTNIYRVAVA